MLDETRHFFYTEPSKWQVVEERVDTGSAAERQFVWSLRYIDDILERDRDTTGNGTLDERLYGMQDANWNVTALGDTGGSVQERYACSAYGVPVVLSASFGSRTASSFDWEIRFAGYRWDAEDHCYCVRVRVYQPGVGKWLSRDPVLTDGPNRYAFVRNGPASLRDPSGLKVQVCHRQTNIPILGEWCGAQHYWIETDTESVGRGTRDKKCNACPCAKTRQVDHSLEPTKTCIDPEDFLTSFYSVFYCNGTETTTFEECVDEKLEAGTPLGPFIPILNDCKSFVSRVLAKCCEEVVIGAPGTM